MKKIIVTTTIYPPSEATLKFSSMTDWEFLIVGDLKTPHGLYKQLEKKHKQVHYIDPEIQKKKYPKLSNLIGWNSIQRRNIGFIEAYNRGADIIASVDDDNIPLENWGKNLLVSKEANVSCHETKVSVFDPLSVTKNNHLWHRGYPIELLSHRLDVVKTKQTKRKVLVQADLWNGDPDIDAICRVVFSRPIIDFNEIKKPYCSNKISPFNSQNTFISRKALPFYAVLPHIGRMDDIYGSYILQHYFPNSVAYGIPSVFQDRNTQDPIRNLENEIFGLKNTFKFVSDLPNFLNYLPRKTREFWFEYRKLYEN
jgi:hypothetical protein